MKPTRYPGLFHVSAEDFPPRTTVADAVEILRRRGFRLLGVGLCLFAARVH